MKFTTDKLQSYLDEELSASREYIVCAGIEDKKYINEILSLIKIFSTSLDYEEIENKFIYLKSKTDHYINIFNTLKNFNDKYSLMIKIKGYFSLLEGTVENSLLTKRVVLELEKEYKDKYLDIISKCDQSNLSVETEKFLENSSESFVDYESKNIKLYLLLKQWQDITHSTYLFLQEIVFNKFVEQLCNGKEFKNSFMKDQFVMNNFINNKLQNKLISLDEISYFIDLGFSLNIKNILGGKSYGLGVLNLLKQDVPCIYVVPIDYNITKKDMEIFSDEKHYSVRSSANIEDGNNFSFAGMFDSYLDVKKNDLLTNINKVKDSVNNKRVKEYINKFDLENPLMAVIIQEFEEPTKSGVYIGTDLNSGILEYTDGNGEKIVSGKVIPNREIWANDLNNKCLLAGHIRVGEYLLNLQKVIYDKYKILPDFEWCIKDNKLKMLQFRASTTQINMSDPCGKEEIDNNIIVGVPCSKGTFEGVAQFIRNPIQLKDLKKGNALLSVYTDPEWVQNLTNANAIITAMGGFLCHSAIIARELGVPCVTGIGIPNLMKIKDKNIILNGDKGEIFIK